MSETPETLRVLLRSLEANSVVVSQTGAKDALECERVLKEAQDMIAAYFLAKSVAANAKESEVINLVDHQDIQSKFSSASGVFEGKFGNVKDFSQGLEGFIGLPNPNVENAIRNEHQYSNDSHDKFELNGLLYSPFDEYELIVSPDIKKQYPAVNNSPEGRSLIPIESFMTHEDCGRAGLLKEEVVALRLYTGPMFVKYNAVLRRFPQCVVNGLKGNRYTTTIHAIVSGIIKLSHIMVLPSNRKVISNYCI